MLSKSCKYAIRATIFVASKMGKDDKPGVKQISKAIDAPEAFTAKILQTLTKHKIISSLKGPYGGFFIESYQLGQPVINIVNAVDGLSVFKECGLGLKQCSEKHPCPMHNEYKQVRNKLLKTFEETTIEKLVSTLNEGNAYISNFIGKRTYTS